MDQSSAAVLWVCGGAETTYFLDSILVYWCKGSATRFALRRVYSSKRFLGHQRLSWAAVTGERTFCFSCWSTGCL